MKVLIVDDSSFKRKVLASVIERHGHEVLEAGDGEEGLQKAGANMPDIIISDLLMPRMDGFQFLRNIKKDEQLRAIPFVVYSATYKVEKVKELVLSLGASGILEGLDKLDRLWQEVQEIISRGNETQANRPIIEEDEEFLRDYSRILASKLEEKVIELEKNIIELNQAEEALKKYSEELEERVKERTKELEIEKGYLESLHNSIGDAVFSVKIPERVIEFANRSVEAIFGYKPEEMIGQKTVGFYPDEKGYLDFGKKLTDAIEQGENILHTEHALKRKNGEIFPAEITTTFFKENSGHTKVVSIVRDITERKKAEEALQNALIAAETANRAKSVFVANMSHELRTPLNAVIGFSEVIKDGMAGPVTDAQKEYANDILESGRHLLSIITDILDLSRIEAGKEELEITEFPLEALIKESLMMFNEKAIKHNIKLTTDVAEDIGSIKADARKIKQVVINLLSNAMKFTPDGGSVSVYARRVGSRELGVRSQERIYYELITQYSGLNENFVEISVEDTGIGIKEEDMQRLFRPFEQIEVHLTKKYAGTGLGLTLCKKFVEMHNGSIWAESEFGKGSRFTFIIPIQQPT